MYGYMKKYLITVFIIVVLALGGVAYYFYNQYQNLNTIINNPNKAAQEDINQTLTKIGKFMLLPAKEQPTLATVVDASKLKTQPFFANAKNGDRVILYVNSKLAILYRPSENKIINVGPLSIQNPSPTPTPSGKVELSPTKALLKEATPTAKVGK